MRSIPALTIALIAFAAFPVSGFTPPTPRIVPIVPAVRRGDLVHLSAGFFGGGGGGGSDEQGDERTDSGQKKISQKRRAQLGINADEEEYDLVRTAWRGLCVYRYVYMSSVLPTIVSYCRTLFNPNPYQSGLRAGAKHGSRHHQGDRRVLYSGDDRPSGLWRGDTQPDAIRRGHLQPDPERWQMLRA